MKKSKVKSQSTLVLYTNRAIESEDGRMVHYSYGELHTVI